MTRYTSILGTVALVAVLAAAGCRPQHPFYLFEDGDLSHYVGVATEIEFPDVEVDSLAEVRGGHRPMTLDTEDVEFWDLTLEEAVQIALTNGKVIRSLGAQVSLAPDSLTRLAEAVPSVYDPALAEAHPTGGVEGALAIFDPQLTAGVFWEKLHTPVNLDPERFPFGVRTSIQDIGNFQTRLSKTMATGGTFGFSHNARYNLSNSPTREWPADWTVNLEADFRQPLLQGAGVGFNRIAGPGAQPGIHGGVVIARINSDIALTDFEAQVRNLVNDIERAYWALYLAYREKDAVVAGLQSATASWRRVEALRIEGAVGGEAVNEAQAREQVFLFQSLAKQRLSTLYATENNLRYLMGLAATDGRLIRPSDEPTTARMQFDWHEVQAEGLVRNAELRRQKWRVKQREMELVASRNHLLPRLDATGRYRWLGLGETLIDTNRENPSAWSDLTGGENQEWQFGLELNVPIGFRRQHAGVRHSELALARERVLLREQELEFVHQLSNAVRMVEDGYRIAESRFNQRVAADHQVDAVQAAFEAGQVPFSDVLNAQRQLAEAEIEYFRALAQYHESITTVHFRKGSLLSERNIMLAEGPWPAKAYFDAHGRARARDAALFIDYGMTQPQVISRGAYEQHPEGPMWYPSEVYEEPLPSPAPAPTSPAPALPSPEEPLLPRAAPTPAPPLADGGSGTTLEALAADIRPTGTLPANQAGWQTSSRPVATDANVRPVSHEVPAASTGSGWQSTTPAAPAPAGGQSTRPPVPSQSGWRSIAP